MGAVCHWHCRTHETRIQALIDSPTAGVRAEFGKFANALRENLNDSISDADAVSMLSQHMITRPVFEALFSGHAFTQHNPVSQVMQRMVETLQDRGLEAETAELQEFYDSVRRRVAGIDTTAGRQQVIRDLYESFFQLAFPKDARSLGVVYTPVEIVDFIIRSVETLLQREFDASLSEAGVHVLDPFAGTGTFITRLLESGYIQAQDLVRKYQEELHANELLLLAYYIAAVNIETTYATILSDTRVSPRVFPDVSNHSGNGVVHKSHKYQPFEGIVLTDTFQLSEVGNRLPMEVFPRNSRRAKRQLGLSDIRVIVGNPPWSIGQRSQNDNNPNQSYQTLDGTIEQTYAAKSAAGLKRSIYDSYSRAIRWASNRVLASDGGGIVGLVTNAGFIDGKSFDGFRKTLSSEFHSIYCLNLRGHARGSGEIRRRESGSVFGGGTRAGVAVILVVKRPASVSQPAKVHYHDIGDYLTREQKLARVQGSTLDSMNWTVITPDEHGDWIDQRDPRYFNFRPLASVRGEARQRPPIFKSASYGLNTSRDAWAFNSSELVLKNKILEAADFFNSQSDAFRPHRQEFDTGQQRLAAARAFVDREATRFSWDRSTEMRLARGESIDVQPDSFRNAAYRPFFCQRVYMNRTLNAEVYKLPQVFPTASADNIGIFVTSFAVSGTLGVLAVDAIPALHFAGTLGRIFPRHVYMTKRREPAQGYLLKDAFATEPQRSDNLNPVAMAEYRARFGLDVTADHVFAYVYAILHSSEYRERYAIDLSKHLPRIPDVVDAGCFHAFAESGQRLLNLHLGYEEARKYPLTEEWCNDAIRDDSAAYRVVKMRFAGTRKNEDRSTLVFNDHITLRGIPKETHDYLIGPRSALGWLMNRYQVKTDKASGIVNDPNDWATEHGQPRYILDLVKRIVTVSLETLHIVRNLPPLDEAS